MLFVLIYLHGPDMTEQLNSDIWVGRGTSFPILSLSPLGLHKLHQCFLSKSSITPPRPTTYSFSHSFFLLKAKLSDSFLWFIPHPILLLISVAMVTKELNPGWRALRAAGGVLYIHWCINSSPQVFRSIAAVLKTFLCHGTGSGTGIETIKSIDLI